MNCAESKELLVEYIEGLLGNPEGQAVVEHLKDCGACRTELEGLQTLQQRLVGNGKALAQGSVEDEVMNRIIREQNARLKSARAGAALQIRRLIMKSPVVKVAAAAAVILVCLGALSLWKGTDAGVALADVLARVEKVQAFMYKMTMHMEGQMQGMSMSGRDTEASILIANEHGMRMDMSMVVDPNTGRTVVQQMYFLPEQKVMLMLMPAMKTYSRVELDESMFEEAKKKNNDPRMMIKQVLDCEYRELGRSVIDGIEVEGFQTNDPAYMGGSGLGDVDVKLWVDVKTWLPVQVEMYFKMGEDMEMRGTLHDFQWDVPVDTSEFNPIIPADYTAGPGDGMKVPPITEETALEGLKLCRELSSKYPDDLNLMTLMRTVSDAMKNEPGSMPQSLRQPPDPATSADDQKKVMMDEINSQVKEAMDKMMPVQMLGAFYMKLVQEQKEPAYYGEIVTPGDIAQVLLRWKTGDNEYRVIFADLHAETVTADTLAKLEAALPR